MFRKNKKIIGLVILLFIVGSLIWTIPNTADAQGLGLAYKIGDAVVNAILNSLEKVLTFAFKWVAALVMALAATFLSVTGLFLDEVMKFTVIDMSANLKLALEPEGGIYQGWTVYRDLANMFFIFILLYISIGTILGLDSVNTKKLLVHVIIVALLLNFSLFFTKIIIDASNILAIGFYEAITVNTGGLSTAFMQPLGLTTFYDVKGAEDLLTVINETQKTLGMMLLASFSIGMFLITGFVFLMASLMFIMRYIILIILMFLSPLAFLAMALPKDPFSKKWWDALFSQAIFAPVFFAILWAMLIGIKVLMGGLTGESFSKLPSSLAVGAVPPVGTINLLIIFVTIISGILASLIIARQISQAGAGGITQFGQKTAARWAGNLGGAVARTALRPARFLHEKATQTRFFQRGPQQAIMEATLGAAMRTKIGAKSTEEAHREDITLRSRRDAIKDGKIYSKKIAKLTKERVSDDDERMVTAKAGKAKADRILENSIYTAEYAAGKEKVSGLERELKLLREVMERGREEDTKPQPGPVAPEQQSGQPKPSSAGPEAPQTPPQAQPPQPPRPPEPSDDLDDITGTSV